MIMPEDVRMTAIVSLTQNMRSIGFAGSSKLLWNLEGEMGHFKKVTTGGIVVMGSNTFHSFGGRTLPNRLNIVVTSKPEDIRKLQKNNLIATTFDKLYDVLAHVQNTEAFVDSGSIYLDKYINAEIFCIGGAQLYSSCADRFNRMLITEVSTPFHRKNIDYLVSSMDNGKGKHHDLVEFLPSELHKPEFYGSEFLSTYVIQELRKYELNGKEIEGINIACLRLPKYPNTGSQVKVFNHFFVRNFLAHDDYSKTNSELDKLSNTYLNWRVLEYNLIYKGGV